MHLFHHYHRNQITRVFRSDFWMYEFSMWLHMFARSLIAIFVPILMLKIGYAISDIILYYLIYSLIDIPLNFLGRSFVERIGARWTIVIATVWTIGFFLALSFLTLNNWPLLLLLAFLLAAYDTFYWVAHRFLFIKSTRKIKDAGEKNRYSVRGSTLRGIAWTRLWSSNTYIF